MPKQNVVLAKKVSDIEIIVGKLKHDPHSSYFDFLVLAIDLQSHRA